MARWARLRGTFAGHGWSGEVSKPSCDRYRSHNARIFAAHVRQLSPIVLGIAFAAVVVAVRAIARRLPIPPPILQVAAGFLIGLLPGVSIPPLEPDVVFFVFLPPILWAAAFFTSLRDFNRYRRPIWLLAIGLVLATSIAVAAAARALFPGMSWAAAVALGAIVSPPDAVAAIAIVWR